MISVHRVVFLCEFMFTQQHFNMIPPRRLVWLKKNPFYFSYLLIYNRENINPNKQKQIGNLSIKKDFKK